MSNDCNEVNETTKIKNFKNLWQGSQPGWSPPHPTSKKVAISDHSQEGLEELEKGWHCSSWGFRGSELPRIASLQHTPNQHILLHDSLTPLLHVPK